MPIEGVEQAVEDSLSCTTTVAALLFLAEKFPHRQSNSAELSIISGIGRTAMSQIKNAPDTRSRSASALCSDSIPGSPGIRAGNKGKSCSRLNFSQS